MPTEEEKLAKLTAEFEKHLLEHKYVAQLQDSRHTQLVEAIKTLTDSTQGLVDAWRVADLVQRFGKWVSGFAGFAIIVSVIAYLVKNAESFIK